MASGTKLFTALGIGSLVDEGALALETRLVDVLATPLPKVSPEVTIRQLLTHTSGVFDYYDEDVISDFGSFELPIPPFKLLRPIDYLPMIADGDMKFAPGSRFVYSNSGYVLLGAVIEDVTGQSYHRFVDERVFRRCAASASGFFRFDQLPDRVATGYLDDGDSQHAGGQRVVVGHPVAKRHRNAQDPLAHRYLGDHVIDQARGGLGHAAAAAARTESAALARKRHQLISLALGARQPEEAVSEESPEGPAM